MSRIQAVTFHHTAQDNEYELNTQILHSQIKKPSGGDDMAIVTALLGFWH